MDQQQLERMARQLACPSGDDGFSLAEKMNDSNAFITARSIDALAPGPGESIVEIGPANGLLSRPIVQAIGVDGHYIGLELSADMAGVAEINLAPASGARIDIYAGDCRTAPIVANSVDGLVAVNLLYFIDDIDELFGSISTWLRPGGRAVFGMRSQKSLECMPFTRFGFHIRSIDEIRDALDANGFAGVSSQYYDEGIIEHEGLEMPMDSLIVCAETAATG